MERDGYRERRKERMGEEGGKEGRTDRRKESITCSFPIVKNKPIKTNAAWVPGWASKLYPHPN